MIDRVKRTFQEFPLSFRVLVIASFVDGLGGTILFPYFTLYVTRKFDVGMTQAGVLLGIFAAAGLVGNIAGGALTDKIGRRKIVIFGLVSSALGSVAMGLTSSLAVMAALAALVGLLGSIAGPAHQAMVADLLPEEKRSQGYGILRVVGNLAWIFGPTIGGLLAAQSYLWLFVADAAASTTTAMIVYRLIPESMPVQTAEGRATSIWQTLAGYRVVIADGMFVAFLLTSMLTGLAYQQMYSTLAVYLRDVHGVPERGYGLLVSLNALVVVLLQFWIMRKAANRPPMLVSALGTLLYMVGFTMYGFVSAYALFVVAMVVITFGEMLIIPTSQALAARFAPADMRGRYMAFFGLSWTIPSIVGPAAAGMIMDNSNPDYVWFVCGIVLAAATVGFLFLNSAAEARFNVDVATVEQEV